MNRRSFITALAGLPIAGWGAKIFGLPKPKSGITVHGPEAIMIKTAQEDDQYGITMICLRFEDVPFRSFCNVMDRLRPLFGTVNSSCFCLAPARTLIFADCSVSDSGPFPSHSRVGQVICGFRSASEVSPWPGSHRPVDFETEILKALAAD